MKAELLQQAHELESDTVFDRNAPHYVTEKLDGIRFFWDGGMTRGLPVSTVSWGVNVHDKLPRGAAKMHNQILGHQFGAATGLWSRYGRPIYAPHWWLDNLPEGVLLDGELWAGRGRFQETMSIVRRTVNGMEEGWEKISAVPFERLSWRGFLTPRTVDLRGKKRDLKWPMNESTHDKYNGYEPYKQTNQLHVFMNHGLLNRVFEPGTLDRAVLDAMLEQVVANGGEGLMIRNGNSRWIPQRTHNLLKYKPFTDAEAVVVGTTSGQGRLDGMIGAFVVTWAGKQFQIGSGLTDLQRSEGDWVGKTITFRFRELSLDGVPKEPRFVCERSDDVCY